MALSNVKRQVGSDDIVAASQVQIMHVLVISRAKCGIRIWHLTTKSTSEGRWETLVCWIGGADAGCGAGKQLSWHGLDAGSGAGKQFSWHGLDAGCGAGKQFS